MDHMIDKYFRLWWLQIIVTFIHNGFAALLLLIFFRASVTLQQLFFAEFLGSAVVTVYLLFRHTFFSRFDIRFGFFLLILSFLLLFLPFSAGIFYAYMIFTTIATMTFFVPYNILFFEQTKRENHLRDMTFYYSIFVFLGIVSPLFGAYLFRFAGVAWFAIFAIAALSIGFLLSGRVEKMTCSYMPFQALTRLRRVRTITMLDGMLGKIIGVVIPIYSLLYLSDERDYGAFLSLMSLVAVFFSFQIAKKSDKSKNRIVFLYPLSFLAAFVVMSFFAIDSFLPFLIAALLLKGLEVLLAPIRSNVMQDAIEPSPINWVSREVFLNAGRAIVLGIVSLALFLNVEREVFIFLGLLHLAVPCIVHIKKIYARAH